MSTPATLDVPDDAPRFGAGRAGSEEVCLDGAETLDRFLGDVERAAFRIAQMALRDRDEALDAGQDAMLHLAQSYAAWGFRAFEKAHAYLAESNAGRVRGQTFRPEFAPETIAQQAAFLRQQALALVTHEYLATATSPVFFVFGGSLCTHGA